MNQTNYCSPVLWLLPVAYTAVFYSRGSARSTATISYTSVAYGKSQPYDPMTKQQPTVTTTTTGSRGSQCTSYISTAIYGLLTIVMWCMSLAFTFYHWKAPTNLTSRTWAYLELEQARTDPTILGNIPPECATYLKRANISSLGIFDQSFDLALSAGLSTVAFIAACIAMLSRVQKWCGKDLNTQRTCKEIILACMVGTIVALTLGLIATATYVGVTSGQNKHVELRYTNNLETTGGCTFAFVNMDKQWGYWDVKNELGFRVVTSLFGAA